MSKLSDKLERDLASFVSKYKGKSIPLNIPYFLVKEGVRPGSKILNSERIGANDHTTKTDVIIYLENSEPIKISLKLSNADFYGNWYGHKRFLEEFGEESFSKMTAAATNWANEWKNTAKALFVGVSICFGKRPGRTGINFLDVFDKKDIITICKGKGTGDKIANCLYITDDIPENLEKLFANLKEISEDSIEPIVEDFKIAMRPINPMTEGTNRGKNIYAQFVPFRKLDKPTIITKPEELFKLGTFKIVEPICVNHNHILNILESKYNIIIPRKK